MVKKKLVCILVALLMAVTGCSNASGGEEVTKKEKAPEKAPSTLTVTKETYKVGKVEEVVEHDGQLTVTIKGDESQGARGQTLDIVNQSKKLHKKVKHDRLTVGYMYEGQRLLQFSLTKDGKETLEKAHPDIEDYLKKAGHFKN